VASCTKEKRNAVKKSKVTAEKKVYMFELSQDSYRKTQDSYRKTAITKQIFIPWGCKELVLVQALEVASVEPASAQEPPPSRSQQSGA
jgi:hypothetical protein